MKPLIITMAISALFCSCTKTIRHDGYRPGNAREVETANRHISVMQVLDNYPDTVSYDSYDKTFPAVFGKTDYNAVMYHRKYIDTVILSERGSRVLYDFLYLIDQNVCLTIPEYLERIDKKYNKKYRE